MRAAQTVACWSVQHPVTLHWGNCRIVFWLCECCCPAPSHGRDARRLKRPLTDFSCLRKGDGEEETAAFGFLSLRGCTDASGVTSRTRSQRQTSRTSLVVEAANKSLLLAPAKCFSVFLTSRKLFCCYFYSLGLIKELFSKCQGHFQAQQSSSFSLLDISILLFPKRRCSSGCFDIFPCK